MARTKESANHSRLRAMEAMRSMISESDASSRRQAAHAVIKAGLVKSRAGTGRKALDDLAGALAADYARYEADPVEQLRHELLALHRWAKAGCEPGTCEGWPQDPRPDGTRPEPWVYFVPPQVSAHLREPIGRMLLHVARTGSFGMFFDAYCAVGGLARPAQRRT